MNVPADIYSGLDASARQVARDAAVRITKLQGKLVEDIVEIGRELVGVKEAVGHGKFGPWLKAEFDWNERTAQNYMAVAERFGSNPKCVSYLPLATVYRLAAPNTPDTVREQIVGRLGSGEKVEPWAIDREISAAKREADLKRTSAAKAAKKTPETRAKAETALARRRRLAAKQVAEAEKARQRRDEARQAAIALLVSNLSTDVLEELTHLLADGVYLRGGDLQH